MPPPNRLEGIGFTTHQFGSNAIRVLKLFAPPQIHRKLEAQLPGLAEIHDSGKMPHLDVIDGYRWMLAVWSRPAPTRLCLIVEREDWAKMTVAEAVGLEWRARSRAQNGGEWARAVTIQPRFALTDENRAFEQRVQANVSAGRHWAHGLA